MTGKTFRIDGRGVGPDQPPFIIAELSANHNGDIERAFTLMAAAKSAGADAVKLQTYTPDTMTLDVDSPDFLIAGGLWDGYRLYDLYAQAQTPWEWHEQLFAKGRELGIIVFSTPFDETAVDFLEGLQAPAYKIASFEIVDHALIRRVAQTGKPLIISTGMASAAEIEEAVAAARAAGAHDIALLHCTSAYPAPAAEMHLRSIAELAARYEVISGLSDHTMGTAVSVAAVALGADLIEKHVTLKRSDGGPDSAFSLEPHELRELVQATSCAWQATRLQTGSKPSEQVSTAFRRSLYITADLEKGQVLSRSNVRAIRPGYGLAPKYLDQVLGRRVMGRVSKGTALRWELLDNNSNPDQQPT